MKTWADADAARVLVVWPLIRLASDSGLARVGEAVKRILSGSWSFLGILGGGARGESEPGANYLVSLWGLWPLQEAQYFLRLIFSGELRRFFRVE